MRHYTDKQEEDLKHPIDAARYGVDDLLKGLSPAQYVPTSTLSARLNGARSRLDDRN